MKKILVTLLLSSLFPIVAQAQPGVIRIPDKPISTTNTTDVNKTADVNMLAVKLDRMEREMKALTTRNADLQKRISELETKQKEDDSGKLPLKIVVNGLDSTVNKLVKQVNTLETKQAEDDKNTVSAKVNLLGLENGMTVLKNQLATQKAEQEKLFQSHIHQTSYSYITLDDLLGQPNNNKANFYVPYIWLGSKGSSVSKVDKIKSVQSYKGKTSAPLPQTQ